MKELGVYTGALYGLLNLVSLVAIFVFDYYDGKFGGRWGNAGLYAMLLIPPVVVVMALGYALSAYARDRHESSAMGRYRCTITAAAVSTILVLCSWAVGSLLPENSFGVEGLMAYFFLAGLVSAWVCAISRRIATRAA